MADMVNQTLTQLFASSPPRGGNHADRAHNADAQSHEPFANSLGRSMARPEKGNGGPESAANASASPAPEPSSRDKPSTTVKAADTASPPASETKTNAPDNAATADGATEGNATTDAATGTVETIAATELPADAVAEPADLAASLAATPAALAAATANPATATVVHDAGPGTARRIDPLATALSQDVVPDARSAAGKAAVDLDSARSDPSPATGQRFADAAGTALNKLRATPFAIHLDARLEASSGRAAEPAMPLPAAASPSAPNTAALHIPGADRPQTVQAALPIHVSTPVSQSGWADAVGNRVLWLVGRDESRAELMLTPPSLGKLEISLTVSGDSTTAQFVAATPAAREALEQAMPRLREMFEQAGITLAESNVNTASQDQAGERGSGDGQRDGRGASANAALELPRHVGGPWLQGGEGMIDIFA